MPAKSAPVVHALSDAPQTRDLLGYRPYVDSLAELLSQEDFQTPFTLGIYGPWGTGKSTLMHLLRNELTIREFTTIPFQPWQFDDREEVWKALIYTVLDYLAEYNRRKNGGAQEDLERVHGLLRGLGRLAIDEALRGLTDDRVDVDKLSQMADVASQHEREKAQFLNTFRGQFRDLKNEVLGENDRFYVFVDDLDRCTPEACLTVLEAIKLFFDMSGCVFVLGIDREVVQQGIEVKYQSSNGGASRINGQDYLEKIIQLPFVLPAVERAEFARFVQIVTRPFEFDETTIALLTEAAEGNPRRVKRLANCMGLTRAVAGGLIDQNLDDGKIALLLLIQVRFPAAYRWLVQNPKPIADMLAGWGDEGGTRERIEQLFRRLDGDKRAPENAAAVRRLLDFAMGVEGFADFENSEELEAYLRVTGVVEEPSERLENIETATAYDDALIHSPTASGNIDPSQKTSERPAAADVIDEDIDETWNKVSDGAMALLESWSLVGRRSATSAIFGQQTGVADDIERNIAMRTVLQDQLQGISWGPRDQEARLLDVELRSIRASRAEENLRAAARMSLYAVLGAPLMVFLLAGAVRFLSLDAVSLENTPPLDLLIGPPDFTTVTGALLAILAGLFFLAKANTLQKTANSLSDLPAEDAAQ